MREPPTIAPRGSDDTLTPRGLITFVHTMASDELVSKINITEVAMNIAHWTEELVVLDRRKRELQKQLQALQDDNIRPIERHIIRLHARLKELTPAMESFI